MHPTLQLLLVALLALPAVTTAFLAARPSIISRPVAPTPTAAAAGRSRAVVSMQAAGTPPSDEELVKVFGRLADKVGPLILVWMHG